MGSDERSGVGRHELGSYFVRDWKMRYMKDLFRNGLHCKATWNN